MQPAIELARDGFEVTSDLVRYMDLATAEEDFLTEDPIWAREFAPNGTRVQQGDILVRSRFASTLEEIARDGPDAFYKGRIAEATIRALREQGGIMTLEDLEKYSLIIREPVQTDYRGYTLTSIGAPSSGAVTLSILKTIEGYEGFDDPANVNLSIHRLNEAMRFGFAAVSGTSLISSCTAAHEGVSIAFEARRSCYERRARRFPEEFPEPRSGGRCSLKD